MIETIYNQESQEAEVVRLPKNIHQIGSGDTKCHIYIEDKVSGFLKLLPENKMDIRYGVLLGNVKFSKGEMYAFIRAAVEVRDVLDNMVLFGDDVWTGIYDDIKRYYHGEKIIGWYTSIEEFRERDLFQMRKIHLDHFAGNDKLYLNINREESEEDFYIYSAGELQKVLCYHIYYEKNPDLERYIFETHYDFAPGRKSVEVKTDSVQEKKKKLEMMEQEKEKEDIYKEDYKEEIGKTAHREEEIATRENKIKKESQVYRRLFSFSGKAASVFVIGGLLLTLGVMNKRGQLDNLSMEIKEVVAGIMNKPDTLQKDDIVLLDDWTEEDGEASAVDGEAVTNRENDTTGADVKEETTAENESAGETTTEEQTTASEQTTAETQAATQDASILPENTKRYEIKKGDTLYGICRNLYGNTDNIEVIMELNHLDSADSITYGKTLIVP